MVFEYFAPIIVCRSSGGNFTRLTHDSGVSLFSRTPSSTGLTDWLMWVQATESPILTGVPRVCYDSGLETAEETEHTFQPAVEA